MISDLMLNRREALLASPAIAALSQPGRVAIDDWLDALVTRTMAEFDQPGLAIALVAPGGVEAARGWGHCRIGSAARVGARTRFAIASHSKAMTAACLAMLVDEGRIGWDDRVTRHLPDFAMADPIASQGMTVLDLLVHRSGLGLGAGDLMFFPRARFTRAELVHKLRYLRPTATFRERYAYDNVLYVVAGALIEAVSGMDWETFVQRRLFVASGMMGASPSPSTTPDADRAGAHGRIGGAARGIGRMQPLSIVQDGDQVAPAAGVHACAADMLRWMRLQIGGGVIDGKRLWSEQAHRAMWTPHVIIRATDGPTPDDPSLPVCESYALGWRVRDYRGVRRIGHTGFMQGMASETAMLPALGVGISVLTNAEELGVRATIVNTVLDRWLGASPFDWLTFHRRAAATERAAALATLRASPAPSAAGPLTPRRPLTAYAGYYRDVWYGDIVVAAAGGGLTVAFSRSPDLRGSLVGLGDDRFRTDFGNPELEDAIAHFRFEGAAGSPANRIVLTASSPLADFSYDYQDLDLRRV